MMTFAEFVEDSIKAYDRMIKRLAALPSDDPDCVSLVESLERARASLVKLREVDAE